MPTHQSTAQTVLVHDYITQRGGAERVVLGLLKAFPGAPLYTSTYHPAGTYPEFAAHDVRVSSINRVPLIRRHHRLGLPLYAAVFSRMTVDAEVALCSSSGWAHGARVTGRKIVYCHNPARWLYQSDQYMKGSKRAARAALDVVTPKLRDWDRRAAESAESYIVNSTVVAERVRAAYGITPVVIPPPPAVVPGTQRAIPGMEPGFFLSVARLQPYKNVDAIVEAFRARPGERLVVVGDGPCRAQLHAAAGPNTVFLERVSDAELRWLYAHARAVVAASYEDYGLTPLEAASFGKPVAVLRWGGFLDTVVEGATGVFFDAPRSESLQPALDELLGHPWDADEIRAHADRFSTSRFVDRIHAVLGGVVPVVPVGATTPGGADRR